MLEHSFEQSHMGTRVSIKIYSNLAEQDILEKVKNAFYVFQKLDEQFSLFKKTSEISEINQNAGRETKVSALFFETAEYALKMAEKTDGLFNPLIGNFTAPKLVETNMKNSSATTFEKKSVQDFRNVEIYKLKNTIRIPAYSALDLNAVVKGMAIDMAMECFNENENVIIEAGGDIKVQGLPPNSEAWKIGIRNPFETDKIITVLTMKSGALCTSAGYFRKEKAAENNYFHLYNPKENNDQSIFSSLTVVAPTAKEADALSTAAFFMSVDKAVEFVEKFSNSACMMVDFNKEIYASPSMKSYFVI